MSWLWLQIKIHIQQLRSSWGVKMRAGLDALPGAGATAAAREAKLRANVATQLQAYDLVKAVLCGNKRNDIPAQMRQNPTGNDVEWFIQIVARYWVLGQTLPSNPLQQGQAAAAQPAVPATPLAWDAILPRQNQLEQ